MSLSCLNSFCNTVTSDGSVFSWGDSRHGALGRKEIKSEKKNNVMTALSEPKKIESLDNVKVTNIFAGFHHCMVLTEDKQVYGWGDNRDNQLGIGNNLIDLHACARTCVDLPLEVVFLNRYNQVQKISCGARHTLAIVTKQKNMKSNKCDEDTVVFGCGDKSLLCQVDTEGILKEINPISKFQQDINSFKINDVQAGEDFSLVLMQGRVYSFGTGIYGQLGYGHVWDQEAKPAIVESLRDVQQIIAGYKHSLAIVKKPKEDKELWSWGFNAHGQLGLNDFNLRLQPHYVRDLVYFFYVSYQCVK